MRSQAMSLSFAHNKERYDLFAQYRDFGDGFRADDGFVPQVGYREWLGVAGLRFYPKGLLNFLRTYFVADYFADRDGKIVSRTMLPGILFQGRKNLTGFVEGHIAEKARVGDQVQTYGYVAYFLQVDPSRRFSRVSVQGRVGEDVDFANARVGTGATVSLAATVRPDDHLQIDANGDRQWLDVRGPDGRKGRLFTATIGRLKATYHFTSKAFVRLIAQYITTTRDPALYSFEVPAKSGDFLGSALFSYKVNWQTVLFLGYGDERVLTERNDLVKAGRQIFLKVSYAFQR